jgi:glycerate 2-kinase
VLVEDQPFAGGSETRTSLDTLTEQNSATGGGEPTAAHNLRFRRSFPIIKQQQLSAMATQRQLPPDPHPDYAHGRQLAQRILGEALGAVDIRRAMLQKIQFRNGDLKVGDEQIRVAKPAHVVAFGKAATRMAATLYEILGGLIKTGVVVTPVEPVRKVERLQYFTGGHPYPSQGSLDGASAALKAVSGLKSDDLVIFLISGGGSAIFEKPLDPAITLADLVAFNRMLVTSDLPIEQINVLRKHISAVKGGRLAVAASAARQVTIFVSDVPEASPSMVASGPTMLDESTCEQSYSLAQNHNLLPKFPPGIRNHFQRRTLRETPKPEDHMLPNAFYFCLLSNRDAVESAKKAAADLGFYAEIGSGVWDAGYTDVADAAIESLDLCARMHPGQPTCVVVGGEVTCPVTGPGIGGRNLSFALYTARKISERRRVVLSAATDGRDGNSPSSGAVADGNTVLRARALGLDPAQYLSQSDAYHFFRTLGDTIETGYTENNVRDLRLFMSFE